MENPHQLENNDQDQDSFKTERKHHSYGNISQEPECYTLDVGEKRSLLIAPFRSYSYGYQIIIWDPKTLKPLGKFHGDKIWKFWHNFYAIIPQTTSSNLLGDEDEEKGVDILIYRLIGTGMRKLRKISMNLGFSLKGVTTVHGSTLFKTLYIIGGKVVCTLDKSFKVMNTLCGEGIIKLAFICEDLKLLLVCSWNVITAYPLDDKGVPDALSIYEIWVNNDINTACLENDELLVITQYNDNIYTQKFKLTKNTYTKLEEKSLIFLPMVSQIEVLPGNKMIMCHLLRMPFCIVDIESGKIVFQGPKHMEFFKMDSEKRTLFTTEKDTLYKLIFETNR